MKLLAMFPAEIVVFVDSPVFRLISPLTLSPEKRGRGTKQADQFSDQLFTSSPAPSSFCLFGPDDQILGLIEPLAYS